MKAEQLKEKFKNFCARVGKKNFIIIGAVVLIAAAVTLNIAILSRNKDDSFNYDQSAGMDGVQTDSSSPADTGASVDDYFSTVQLNRQRSRDEAIEVLQSVVDNTASTETAKNEALAQINDLAKVMETEANIESLIVAKGFEECVAVISGESASIVVKSDGLIASEISQINEIVFTQAGIKPVNVKIIER